MVKNYHSSKLLIKIFIKISYQPVTKNPFIFKQYKSYLVETSETIRDKPKKNKNETQFNQWLAGLIDGDGCLLVNKQGYTSCEITVALADEKALIQIKNQLGGSIKLRSGVRAVRWRLQNKEGIIKLIHKINGHIQHSNRIKQLHKVCTVLNIIPLESFNIDLNNAWFSGIFDSDGSVFIWKDTNGYYKLTISVYNKFIVDVKPFQEVFGGSIYYDQSKNGGYRWALNKRSEILNMLLYFHKNIPRTSKIKKIMLINTFYDLIDIKAYKIQPNSCQYKAWLTFIDKWNNISN